MILSLRDLQEESQLLEGTWDVRQIGLEEAGASTAGELQYHLEAGLSGGGLWVRGNLRLPVKLTCVNCLASFVWEVEIPDFAMQTQVEGSDTIDLTEWIREDILLALPPYPKCDSAGGRNCPAKFPPVEHAPGENSSGTASQVWSALDKIKPKNN